MNFFVRPTPVDNSDVLMKLSCAYMRNKFPSPFLFFQMSKVRALNINQIPDDLLNDKDLNEQIRRLPANYNFEIHKTIWRIRCIKGKRGCFFALLQNFPLNLLSFSRDANARRFVHLRFDDRRYSESVREEFWLSFASILLG